MESKSFAALRALSAAIFVLCALAVDSPAQTPLVTQLAANNLELPVYVTAPAGDPRLFVVEQGGAIQVIKPGSVFPLPTPFLDLSAIIGPATYYGEQGLLGMAFHPDYSNNGFVYLRNSNDFGTAELEFFYGLGGDVPFVGDWDADGCDSLAIYRDGRVYLRNELSTGFADLDFFYGIASDVPFGGDFDADGSDSVGLYRPASGFVFLRNKLSGGFAEADFFFGIPGDRVVAFDWDEDGDDTVAIFRPDETRFYIVNTNGQGAAELDFRFGREGWLPVAGRFVS